MEPDGPVAVIYHPSGAAPAERYKSVQVAYEALRDVDLEFSVDLLEREDERSFPGALTFSEGEGESHTMWFARNDAHSLRQLESGYREALKRAEAYRQSGGTDFLTAYSFIDGHPAFWIRPDRSGSHAL